MPTKFIFVTGGVVRGWKFSKSEAGIKGPAPQLGEGNEYILKELLGVEQDRIDAFAAEWIIGNTPEGSGAPGTVSLDEQVELGWIAEFDPGFLDRLPPA